jgi:hypothetical protein
MNDGNASGFWLGTSTALSMLSILKLEQHPRQMFHKITNTKQ